MAVLSGVGFDPFMTMISVLIDGGGEEIADAVAVPFGPLPEGGIIKHAYAAGLPSGSIQIDVWRKATFPPLDANSITGSTPIVITTATQGDTRPIGWDIQLNRGDWLLFSVDSCTTMESVLVTLWIQRQVNDNL